MIGPRSVSTTAAERQALAKCALFTQLPPEPQQILVEAARMRELPRKTTMVRQGDPLTGVAYVVRGVLRLWLPDASGREHTVMFGWTGAISMVGLGGPVSELPWNATAVVPSTICMIPWDVIAEARDHCPIDQALMAYAAMDFRRRHLWEGLLRGVHLRPRLLLILRRLGDEFGRRIADGMLLDFPVTHTDLGHLAYVTRDEVGRVMREFATDGLVKPIGRRGMLFPDLDRLGPPTQLD